MGSGKSTLGALVARRCGVAFTDLDAEIEHRAGCSVAAVFARDGESGFRRRELQTLAALVPTLPVPAVLATGGGIVETDAALPLLRQAGRVVWLRADPSASVERLGAARAARPLLQADWRQRFAGRESRYAAWSDAVVSTHPEAVAESLTALLALCPFTVPPE